MLKIVNFILVLILVAAAFVVYSLEYSIRKSEREIAIAERQTQKAEDTIRLLSAEWAMLTRPARLQRMAGKYLKLAPMRAEQVVDENFLKTYLPSRPAPNPAKTDKDPIAAMLKGLEK